MRRPIRLSERLARPWLALLVLAGCATTHASRERWLAPEVPSRMELTGVPFFPQEPYQCGPASLAVALTWAGSPVRPEELVAQVYSAARRGSLPIDMTAAARRRGRVAYPISTLREVVAEVAAGHPVVVLRDVGTTARPRWHFAVVVGYDLDHQHVILRSGLTPREITSFSRFERTWAPGDHWGLLVLSPLRLPATAKEHVVVEAIAGLERARQWQAAADAYEAAHQRWPASLGALIGLGNSRYALRDLPGAERAFRLATEAHPEAPDAFTNLAHVLTEMGRLDEARDTARHATGSAK